MIYYVIPSLLIFGMLLFSRKGKNHIVITIEDYTLFCLIIFCVIFSTLRYETGSDWDIYYSIFQNIDSYWNSHFEKGYILLNYLISSLNLNYNFLLLIVSSFYALLYYFISQFAYNKWIFSLFIYANTYISFWSGRQGIAIVLACIGTVYLLRRNKFLIAFIYWLAALQFHLSSILIPIQSILSLKFKFRYKQIIFFSFLLNFICLISSGNNPFAEVLKQIIPIEYFGRFSSYLDGGEYVNQQLDYSSRNIIILLSNCITLFLFFIFGDRLTKKQELNSSFLIICSISYIIFALFLDISRNASGRGLLYGRPFEAIIISYLPYMFKSNYKKVLMTSLITIAILIKIYFTFVTQGFYLPYKHIL